MIRTDTRPADLVFLRDELLYDAANAAFVAGDVMQVQDEHQRHQAIDIIQDGSVDRVTRVLNLAMAACREALYPFTRNDVGDYETRDDVLEEVEEYVIHMEVPPTFSKTTLTLLEQLIHEFLVARVLADWMSQTNPAAEATWKKKAEDALTDIHRAKNHRTGKTRRRLHPFG